MKRNEYGCPTRLPLPLSIATAVSVSLVGCQETQPVAPGAELPRARADAVTRDGSTCTSTFTVDPTYSDRTVFGLPFSGWQETGVTLGNGDPVSLAATGTVCLIAGIPWTCYAPGGSGLIPEDEGFAEFLVPSLSHGGLVGRIGTGAPFLVGSTYHAAEGPGGPLLLGVNDSRVDDNTGFFQVSILGDPSRECQAELLRALLDALLENAPLTRGQATSLDRKLTGALDHIERGRPLAAVGLLEALRRELEGLTRAGVLSSAESRGLSDGTRTLIERLRP